MTDFMQACDVFEKFKVVGSFIELQYVIETDENFSNDELKKFIKMGLAFAKAEFEKNLVYAHIQHIQFDDVKIENTSEVPIVDPEISVVSDGEKWGLVVDQIKSLCKGIEIEEGEIRKIKSMTWPQQKKTLTVG